MFIRLVFAALLTLCCLADVRAEPVPVTDPAIAEGVRLHDEGQFAEAVAQYQQALVNDPASVLARYEMTLSYIAMKDYAAALEVAREAVLVEHRLRPKLYMLIGTVQDETGDSAGAIATYKEAIALEPSYFLLYFNLGITYLRQEDHDQASAQFQSALMLNPEHASSHFYLAYSHEQQTLRSWAILAYTRFLLLEQQTQRSEMAVAAIHELFTAGYSKDDESGDVKLTVDIGSAKAKSEQVAAMDLALLLSQAAAQSDEPADHPPEIERLLTAILIMTELGEDEAQDFVQSYYVPYFVALQQQSLLEAAGYMALQSTSEAASNWVQENATQVVAAKQLGAEFEWHEG